MELTDGVNVNQLMEPFRSVHFSFHASLQCQDAVSGLLVVRQPRAERWVGRASHSKNQSPHPRAYYSRRQM